MTSFSDYASPGVQFVQEGHNKFLGKTDSLLQQTLQYVTALSTFTATPTTPYVDFNFSQNLTPFLRPATPVLDFDSLELTPQSEPGLPAAFDPQTPDLGTAPTFTAEAPVLAFGAKPDRPNIARPVAPGRPAALVIPDEPDYESRMPEPITLLGLNLPSFPDLTMPEFTATRPTSNIPELTENWTFVPEDYTSTLFDALKAKIAVWMEGEQALPIAIERALFDRGRSRVTGETQALVEQAYDDFGARGFTAPPGMLVGRIDAIRQDGQNKTAELNRELTIQAYTEALTNMRLAVQQGIALEGVAVNLHLEEQKLLLQSAQFLRETAVAILNARVAEFNANMQGYSIDASVYKTQIEAKLSELEETRILLEGEKLKGEFNQQTVQNYVAQWEAVKSMASFYATRLEGVKIQGEADRIPIQIFSDEVKAYDTLWDAYAKEWDGYKSAVDAEATKGTMFSALANAFAAESDAYVKVGGLKMDKEKLRLAEHGQNLQVYDATLRRLNSLLETEKARLGAAAAKAQSQVQLFSAQAQLESAASASTDRSFELGLTEARARVDTQLETARIRSSENLQLSALTLEALKTLAQVMSQLSASMVSAVNYSASVTTNDSFSHGRSVSWSGEAKDWDEYMT